MALATVAGMLLGAWLALCGGAAQATATSASHPVRGSRSCAHHFRDTLFTVRRDRQFTLTGIGVSFRAPLPDSMYVAVTVTDGRLGKRQEIHFRRGPHSSQASEALERFPGKMVYGPGDTLVVTLHNIDEEYWQLDGWPRHVVRWEGYWTRSGGAAPARQVDTGARQPGGYMRLSVIGGGETITLRDPMGRVAQATDTTAWSRIPACSTGVNPPTQWEKDGWFKTDGGFFFVTEPLVGTWRLQVRRDVSPRPKEAGPNVSVYAERHNLSNADDWADERDQGWLTRGEAMTWRVEVRPPSTPADSSWLHLVRVGRRGR